MTAPIRRFALLGFAAGVVAMMSIGVVAAQADDPANGTWKLDVAKSKFSPGPGYKELTVTVAAKGNGRTVNVVGTTADGNPVKWGYTGNFDRKENPVTGTNPDADTVSLRRLSANTTRSMSKKGGKPTVNSGISVAADGKTMTVATTGVNAKGQKVSNTLVFDKQ